MIQKTFKVMDYTSKNECIIAKNAFVKENRKKGLKVLSSKLPLQLITRGGIGTGEPQIETLTEVWLISIL